MLKEAIRKLVLTGATVTYPFKTRTKDWIGEANISQMRPLLRPDSKTMYGVHFPDQGWDKYKTLDEALDVFCSRAITRRNIALAYAGIRALGWANDLDDLSEAELKALVKRFNDEHFDKLYGDL